PRPGVRARAPGGRDQPRAAADAERAAGGDGRAPGHRGRDHPRAARSLLRDRDPEPGRPRRHLSPARLPARPLPAAPAPGLPRCRNRTRPAGGCRPPRPDRAGAAGARRRGRAPPARGGAGRACQRRPRSLRAGAARTQPPPRRRASGAVATRRHRPVARGARACAAARARPRGARRRAGAVRRGRGPPPGGGRRRRRRPGRGPGDPARRRGGLSVARGPAARLRARLGALARPRGPEPLPVTFDRRRIYVLPTAFGLFFGLLLAVMLLGGLNYNNNPALLLALLLAGAGNTSLVAAHLQLSGLRVAAVEAAPVPAGAPIDLRVHLRAPPGRARRGLSVSVGEASGRASLVDGAGEARLGLRTRRRGWLHPGRITVSTTRPLGLARAWAYAWPATPLLVYPRPEASGPPLPAGEGDQAQAHRHPAGDD